MEIMQKNTQHDGQEDVNSRNGNRFWIDSSCEVAVASLQAEIVRLYLEKYIPSNATIPPRYICRMIPKYTGREYRAICRQVAKLLKFLHGAKTAH
jgi:hypothetical protein